MNNDSSMARVTDLIRFCLKHELKMITVADLARYWAECDPPELWAGLEW
jgi:3,4-dihydroxy-2-butanone 4-phosphate synthase